MPLRRPFATAKPYSPTAKAPHENQTLFRFHGLLIDFLLSFFSGLLLQKRCRVFPMAESSLAG
jgi:hypothetical protein